MNRSFNYLTLTSSSHAMNIVGLRAKLDQVLKDKPSADAAVIVKEFYKAQTDPLRQKLNGLVEQANPILLVREGSGVRDLNKQEIDKFNSAGTVEIALSPQFYNGYGNVRIKGVEVLSDQSEFMVGEKDAQYPGLALNFALGMRGSFNYGENLEYIYPKLGTLFLATYGFLSKWSVVEYAQRDRFGRERAS